MSKAAIGDAGEPRSARRPLGDVAYGRVLDMIVRGDLEPGSPLREAHLADRLGTSRVPVREALQRLAEEGWVVRRLHSGARVRIPTRQDIDEVFDMRMLLESEAARLACHTASLADGDRLREFIAAGRTAAQARDEPGVAEANAHFHAAIAELSGNGLLVQMLELLSRRGRWLFTAVAQSRAPHSLAEHEEMTSALMDRDVHRVQALTRAHVERTRTALLQHWSEDRGPAPPE